MFISFLAILILLPSFDNMLCCAELLSHIQLFATLWTVVHQAPLSNGDRPGKSTGMCLCALL